MPEKHHQNTEMEGNRTPKPLLTLKELRGQADNFKALLLIAVDNSDGENNDGYVGKRRKKEIL